jgi:hypothetical protein
VLEGAQEILDGKTTQLSGVKVVDPYTVEVRFTKPDVLFPIYPFQFMDSGIVAQRRGLAHQGLAGTVRSSSSTGSAGRRSGWPPTRTTGTRPGD